MRACYGRCGARNPFHLTLGLLALVGLCAAPAAGQTTYWQHDPATPGDWHDPLNWSAGLPDSSDTAYIDNGGTALLSSPSQTAYAKYTYVGYDKGGIVVHDEGSASLGYMFLAQHAGSTGSYALSGTGSLTTAGIYVGGRSPASFVHSGGTCRTSYLYLGWNEGFQQPGPAVGTYEMSGDAYLHVEDMLVGAFARGVFIQAGGTVDADGWMVRVGGDPYTQALYDLRAGTLTSKTLAVNRGLFDHSGGTVTVTDALYLGVGGAFGDSVYSLRNSAALVANRETIGDHSHAIFRQTAGTNTVALLRLIQDSRYELHGGSLTIQTGAFSDCQLDFGEQPSSLHIADNAFVNLSRGSVTGARNASVTAGVGSLVILPAGFDPTSGFGSYASEGMTHIAGNTLSIPAGRTVNMGGQVDDHVECAGQISFFNGIGSSEFTRGLMVLPGGTVGSLERDIDLYVTNAISGMSGGEAYLAHEHIGYGALGVFTQTGGRHVSDRIINLGTNGGHGIYVLSGGQMECEELRVGRSGPGTVEHTGGTVTAYRVSAGFSTAMPEGLGEYNLSGTAELTTWGLEVATNGQGAFRQSGGTVNIIGPNYNDGYLIMGRQYNAEATYELSGGSLSARSTSVGAAYTSKGVFRHTGGNHSLSAGLYLGSDAPAAGRYELGGTGCLSAADAIIGRDGTGTFAQDGGQAAITGEFVLGRQSDGTGTYDISAGTLHTGSLRVGGAGQGTMRIAGLAANITVSQRLAFGPGGAFEAVPGATIHMTGAAFQNQSTDPGALAGLKNLALIFEGGAADVDPFEVAGADRGGNWEAFHSNFTLGRLQLGGTDLGWVQLVDAFDNQSDGQTVGEALYARAVRVAPGSTLDLNGLNLYCLSFDNRGTVTGGTVTQVPAIRSISGTYMDSRFDAATGVLTVSDAADVVVESAAGQVTYAGGHFAVTATVDSDTSAGGLASAILRGGSVAVTNSAAETLLSGRLTELELREVFDGAGLLAGSGWFEVDGGLLEEAFGQAWGKVVQITFEIAPADIADFSGDFAGVSNVTLTPIPEPATLGLLVLGGLAVLRRRER